MEEKNMNDMLEYTLCPRCGHKNITTEDHKEDIAIYGKTVVNCDGCDMLYTS